MASPLINGVNYDWGDIQFVLYGVPVIGITEIDYRRRQGKENNYGAGREPVSRGYKNFEYEGSITVYYDEVKAILTSAPNRSILEIPPTTVSVIFGGIGVEFTTDKLFNLEFTDDPFASKQNDSKITVKLPFIFAGIQK